MTDLVGHFFLFTVMGVAFLLLPLILGWFVRPTNPTTEKLTAYECGEPAIGSSYVQFDLRFYVVALLFIIFDVEVAFFFPWAAVYGNATQLMDHALTPKARIQLSEKLLNQPAGTLDDAVPLKFEGMSHLQEASRHGQPQLRRTGPIAAETAYKLALTGFADILVFFGVLLVGFAYVWKRGDLDWVRAVSSEVRTRARAREPDVLMSAGRPLEPIA